MLDLKSVVTIVTQYQNDLKEWQAPGQSPLLYRLQLERIKADLPDLLLNLKQQKSNKLYAKTLEQIYSLSNEVSQSLFLNQDALSEWSSNFDQSASDAVAKEEPVAQISNEEDEESYASLRKRLLVNGSSSTKLDNANHEQLNLYHESIQEELMSELSDLTSNLKSSAMHLSSRISEDAKLVSDTTEHMVKNLSLMQSVGVNLNNYLGAKSGGKISLFFMIKIMVFVFVLFFVMAFVASFLPKM